MKTILPWITPGKKKKTSVKKYKQSRDVHILYKQMKKCFGNVDFILILFFFYSQGPYCMGQNCTYGWAQKNQQRQQ